MTKISRILLRSRNPKAQQKFYSETLGMSIHEDGSVGYGKHEARLLFLPTDALYQPSPTDLYWKIALAVPNIELTYQQLIERGVAVDPPHQFKDIGYLAHFRDPQGFTIELIEHWFQGNRPKEQLDNHLLGGGACLNLLTLRTVDIGAVQDTCKKWGMVPLSIQPVDDYEFTLYFFAFTDDRPPNTDLYSVENREWLYQRNYTVLELQHLHNEEPIVYIDENSAGYKGTVLSGAHQQLQNKQLRIWTE